MYPDAENVRAQARKWGDVPWYRIKTYAMKEDHLINENYKADCINVHPQCNNIHKTSSTRSLSAPLYCWIWLSHNLSSNYWPSSNHPPTYTIYGYGGCGCEKAWRRGWNTLKGPGNPDRQRHNAGLTAIIVHTKYLVNGFTPQNESIFRMTWSVDYRGVGLEFASENGLEVFARNSRPKGMSCLLMFWQ